nr:hypothetical protein [Tanacetum cinerariifolium]
MDKQANMDVKDTEYFDQLVQLKKAYKISGFSCEQKGVLDACKLLIDSIHLEMSPQIALRSVQAGSNALTVYNFQESAIHYYLDSNVPEIYHIKQQYLQMADTRPILNINNQRYEDPELEKNRNRFPLAVLFEIDPQNYRCNHFRNKYTKNGTVRVAAVTENNVQLNSKAKDLYRLPSTLKDLEGPTHTFQFHFDSGSTSKRRDFILEIVFKPTTLSLTAPSAQNIAPASKSQEQPEQVQPPKPLSPALSTIASNEPKNGEGMTEHFQELQSTPPPTQQPTETQKEDKPSNLPHSSVRKGPLQKLRKHEEKGSFLNFIVRLNDLLVLPEAAPLRRTEPDEARPISSEFQIELCSNKKVALHNSNFAHRLSPVQRMGVDKPHKSCQSEHQQVKLKTMVVAGDGPEGKGTRRPNKFPRSLSTLPHEEASVSEYITTRAKNVAEKYSDLMKEKYGTDRTLHPCVGDREIWEQACGGPLKRKIFGFGNPMDLDLTLTRTTSTPSTWSSYAHDSAITSSNEVCFV